MSTPETVPQEFRSIAHDAVDAALKAGAQGVAARIAKVREVGVQWRDGQIEQVTESTTRGLGLSLYVDNRFASVSTSDLRREAIQPFIADAVAMTRTLSEDPFRTLPDPALYADRPTLDLEFADPAYASMTAARRRDLARATEDAARSVAKADRILSVTTSVSDSRSEMFRMTSNGFEGERVDTSFWLSGSVTVQDDDGRRPEEGDLSGGRFISDLGDPSPVGRSSAERALARLGAGKAASGVMTLVLDNRVGGRFVRALLSPLAASAIQPTSTASATVHGLGLVPATTSVNAANSARNASANRSMKKLCGWPPGKVTPGSVDRMGHFGSRPAATLSAEPCNSSRTS